MKIASANPPQSGAVIHHHDQSITCVSFNTSNTRKKRPKKPTPLLVALAEDEDDEEDELLM